MVVDEVTAKAGTMTVRPTPGRLICPPEMPIVALALCAAASGVSRVTTSMVVGPEISRVGPEFPVGAAGPPESVQLEITKLVERATIAFNDKHIFTFCPPR